MCVCVCVCVCLCVCVCVRIRAEFLQVYSYSGADVFMYNIRGGSCIMQHNIHTYTFLSVYIYIYIYIYTIYTKVAHTTSRQHPFLLLESINYILSTNYILKYVLDSRMFQQVVELFSRRLKDLRWEGGKRRSFSRF